MNAILLGLLLFSQPCSGQWNKMEILIGFENYMSLKTKKELKTDNICF